MANYHAILVDADGYKLRFINTKAPPSGFSVGDDQQLIYDDIGKALSLVKPRWMGGVWVEAATKEELDAIEAAKPVPEPAPPSQVEHLAVEVTTAMAEMQLQHDMAIAELTVAIASGTEVSADV